MASAPARRPRTLAALLVQAAMATVFCFWIFIFMFRPTRRWTKFNTDVNDRLASAVYGNSAPWLLLFGAPVFLLLPLAALYLHLAAKPAPGQSKEGGDARRKRVRVGFGSYPVLTRGPLGIVTAGELIGLCLFLAFLAWILISYLDVGFSRIKPSKKLHRWQARLSTAGTRLGLLSYVAMAFLFLPVARGSLFLRFLNVPFEHAVKYHKWLGCITMSILVAHAIAFLALWDSQHKLRKEVTMWNRTGVNNLAGVIAMLSGIAITATSLQPVRKYFFELFFGVHQLYVVFVVFAMMHTGERHFAVLMPGIFLFFLDRFLRFIQSRKSVDLLAVRSLSGGTMELVFAKHPGILYAPASFLFLHIPGLARLQWHPFTLSSSSLAEPDRISILVKPQNEGTWTQELQGMVAGAVQKAHSHDTKPASCPFAIKASIEGPYGHQFIYYLKYDALLLVAGGSGIAPFVSILKDLVHRFQHSSPQTALPTDVTLIWAVKKSEELHVLDTLEIPPTSALGLQLHIMAYVTREESGDLESTLKVDAGSVPQVYNSKASIKPLSPEITRDSIWGNVVVVAMSVLGFLLVWGLINYYYIYDLDKGKPKATYPTWAKGLFSLLSMLLGITFFGGVTTVLWSWWVHARGYRASQIGEDKSGYSPSPNVHSLPETLLVPGNIHYGCRPNLQEILATAAKRLAGKDVGVMVCGPTGMQHNVAKGCKVHSSLLGASVAFHFHSVSFEL